MPTTAIIMFVSEYLRIKYISDNNIEDVREQNITNLSLSILQNAKNT